MTMMRQFELHEASRRSEAGKKAVISWLDQLSAESAIWVDVLVREEVGRMLQRCDLDHIVDTLDSLPEESVACETPGLGQDRIAGALRSFYSSLFSMVAPSFDRLIDPETRELTRQTTAAAVANIYAKVPFLIFYFCTFSDVLI